ncbi:MAG: ABC transporter ATP-binding protein [Chloroflexi bacterium]|nr:ABC transporter ATP-binding protein [Chloroflexota bacterium]
MSDNKQPGSIVKTQGVTRTFQVGGNVVHALRGIDMEVPRGIFAAVMGRSGSGKTTLLNIIGGLDHATAGKIWVDGHPLDGLSEHRLTLMRRHLIGFVFQSFALLPTFSAAENVELPLRIARYSRHERSERVKRALGVVGLTRWAGHRPHELSGGQQQRVAIARALVTRPALILADEPTGELDSVTGRGIMQLFQHIVQEQGVTILMVTHDPTVEEYAHRVYELRDGEIFRIHDTEVPWLGAPEPVAA